MRVKNEKIKNERREKKKLNNIQNASTVTWHEATAVNMQTSLAALCARGGGGEWLPLKTEEGGRRKRRGGE